MTGRQPPGSFGAAPRGLLRTANLPYLLAVVVSLAVLIPFIALAAPFAAEGGGASGTLAAGDPVRGEEIFNATCMVCHGLGGVGVEGLGKPLTTSTFAAGLTDAELLAFLDVGRPSDDPLNTTGIAMPPRGGNPALTDADLLDVIAYVRTLAA